MADSSTVTLNAPHPPLHNSIEAFGQVIHDIKHAIVASRHSWDKHQPEMWSRVKSLSDHDLVNFSLDRDLVQVRSGATSYGTIIFGKLRIPGFSDGEGEGFIHVRIHDSPGEGTSNVKFHSIFTDEGNRNVDGQATTWRAVQTQETPLEFFSE